MAFPLHITGDILLLIREKAYTIGSKHMHTITHTQSGATNTKTYK